MRPNRPGRWTGPRRLSPTMRPRRRASGTAPPEKGRLFPRSNRPRAGAPRARAHRPLPTTAPSGETAQTASTTGLGPNRCSDKADSLEGERAQRDGREGVREREFPRGGRQREEVVRSPLPPQPTRESKIDCSVKTLLAGAPPGDQVPQLLLIGESHYPSPHDGDVGDLGRPQGDARWRHSGPVWDVCVSQSIPRSGA